MNLKCLLLPASRNRIAGKRNISKYLPVDIRMFVCIETYVCMYLYGTSTCKSFQLQRFSSIRMRNAIAITMAAMKMPAPSGTKLQKVPEMSKIGVVCWFCFVSAVRKQRLEMLSASEKRAQTITSERVSNAKHKHKKENENDESSQRWGTRPKLGLKNFIILCNLNFFSRTFVKYLNILFQ